MKKIIGRSVATAIALTLMVSAPMDAAKSQGKAPKLKLSKAVQPVLVEAQKAEQANNFEQARTLLDQANAMPEKNEDDAFMISQMQLGLGLKMEDNALIEAGLDGAVASGKLSEEDNVKYMRNIGALALQREDTAKALKNFEQVLAITPDDTQLMSDVAELYRREGNTQQALATLRKAVEINEAKGTKADENLYKRWLAIAYDGKVAAETAAAGEALVTAYPNPTNWRDTLIIFAEGANFDDQGQLDIFRLQRTLGALAGERDYVEYAETALRRGFPGEAQSIINEGTSKNILSASNAGIKEINAQVAPAVSADKAELPKLERDANSAPNGRTAMGTADAYLGYGDYQKAAALYKTALAKGSVDADTVNLRLGYALGQAGDAKDAKAAFEAVKAAPRAQLARYYGIWLDQKNSPAPAQEPAQQENQAASQEGAE